MPALSIPEAIVENPRLKANAKFAFAEMFARLKKGEKPEITLDSIGSSISLSVEELVESLRELMVEGYAQVDEADGDLADMVLEQTIQLTVHIHAKVQPLYPTDEESVDRRRYPSPHLDDVPWDYAKVGRMIYRASLSGMTGLFEGEYALTVRARHGDDAEQTVVVDKMTFRKETQAWAFFDEFVEGVRDMHERGEVLPGAAGDDPHALVVEALIALGHAEDLSRRASEATIGEGEPTMRIEAATRWILDGTEGRDAE